MIEFEGENYYSCDEIAKRLDQPEQYGLDMVRLSKKFQEVFGQRTFVYSTFVQSKLYPAAKKNLVRHITYSKKNDARTFINFSLKDFERFLDNTNAERVSQKLGLIKNIKVVEAVI